MPAYLKQEIEEETQRMITEQRAIEEKLLNVQLKVYHEGQMREIKFRKT